MPNHSVNPQPTIHPMVVRMPNGSHLQTTHKSLLPIPSLPTMARQAHSLPNLQQSLLSVSAFVDASFDTLFTRDGVCVTQNGQILLSGTRADNGLWQTTLPTKHQAHKLEHSPVTTTINLTTYLHACCFSPTPSTLIQAIDQGFFQSWPNFTSNNIRKHLTKSEATTMGHLDQKRKNQRSTKQPRLSDNDFMPPRLSQSTDTVYSAIMALPEPTGQLHANLTGRFPVQSSAGKNYVFVLYDYDSNSILTEAIKSRAAEHIVAAYRTIYAQLHRAGRQPKLQRRPNY